MSSRAPLYDLRFDAADLAARFPLRWGHPNKAEVHAIACPPGTVPSGELRVRRWATDRPVSVRPLDHAAITVVDGHFAYDDPPSDHRVWYPNFADHDLFGFWDGPLLAQDEMQVAEHPILACVRLALLQGSHSTLTVDRDGGPTPITVQDVARRCAIDTAPSDARPLGLYGNRFSRASLADVRAVTRRLDPPTVTNLVAMCAPVGGRGRYTTVQIEWTVAAAYTAFDAVVRASDGQPTRLHAGFWGCGAFGGNRVLMALLQVLAAGSAGIDRVVFHTSSPDDRDALRTALDHLDRMRSACDDDPSTWVLAVHGLSLGWGISDGN